MKYYYFALLVFYVTISYSMFANEINKPIDTNKTNLTEEGLKLKAGINLTCCAIAYDPSTYLGNDLMDGI